MSYYELPRYWYITGKHIKQNPNLIELIWPLGLPETEYVGEFYHISHQHPNASFLALLLADQQVKYINRNDVIFPAWNKARAKSPQQVTQ